MDDAGNAETALRLCPLSAEVDDEPALGTPNDLPTCSWCCDGAPPPPPRHEQDDDSRGTARLHGTTAGQSSTEASSIVTILHAVDIETHAHGSGQTEGHDRTRERNRCELCLPVQIQNVVPTSDKMTSVMVLAHENSRRRQADNGWLSKQHWRPTRSHSFSWGAGCSLAGAPRCLDHMGRTWRSHTLRATIGSCASCLRLPIGLYPFPTCTSSTHGPLLGSGWEGHHGATRM